MKKISIKQLEKNLTKELYRLDYLESLEGESDRTVSQREEVKKLEKELKKRINESKKWKRRHNETKRYV